MDGSNQLYIVGAYTEDDPSNRTHGFLYDGTTYTTFDVPGATSTSIFGIDGSNIVGIYYSGSSHHGFLAVIPEPATLSLLTVGMLMACRRRRAL